MLEVPEFRIYVEYLTLIASDRLFWNQLEDDFPVLRTSAPFVPPIEGPVASSPIVTDDSSAWVLANGQLLKFSTATLELLKTVDIGGETEWSLASDGLRLYVGTGTALLALNLAGTTIWATELPGHPYYPASIAVVPEPKTGPKHIVEEYLVISAPPNMVALNAETGAAVWSEPAPLNTGQAVVGLTVYYMGSSGLIARDIPTGELLWQYDGNFNRPTVYGGVVYATAGSDQAYAFNATTGDLLWEVSVPYSPGNPVAIPLVDGSVAVVFASNQPVENSFLAAVDGSTGALLWKSTASVALPEANQRCTDLTAIAWETLRLVQVGTPDGRLVTVNAVDGSLAWQSQLSDVPFTSSSTFVNS
jgi:outer membrane protein assembly factor BamB